MLTARLGSPRRADVENMDRPTQTPITSQVADPATRTRAGRHRPRFNPLAKAFGRRNRAPTPPDSPSPPVVDLNRPSYATDHARRERPPTIPQPAAVSYSGGRRGTTPPMPMTTVHYVSGPPADGQYRASSRDGAGDEEGGTDRSSRHFLLCFPQPKSSRVRSQAVSCLVSGTFALLLLALCTYPTVKRVVHLLTTSAHHGQTSGSRSPTPSGKAN